MKLISEEATNVEFLTEVKKDGGKNYFIEGIFMQANKKNRNGRIYPTEILQKEAKRYTTEFIKKKRAFGELGHPDGPTVNLERVSHMIEELEEVDQNFMGRAKILDTPYGKIVKNLIDEGAQLGVSSRGMGSLKPAKDGIQEVQRKYFATFHNTYNFFALYANLDGFTYGSDIIPVAERTESEIPGIPWLAIRSDS